MPGAEELVDLESSVSEVALALFAAGTVNGTLQRIVDLAEHAVDGCEAAGVLLVDKREATTAAASRPFATEVAQLQIEADEGPCLDAVDSRTDGVCRRPDR